MDSAEIADKWRDAYTEWEDIKDAPESCRKRTALDLADLVLLAHWDMARCYCPTCVIARAFVSLTGGDDHGEKA